MMLFMLYLWHRITFWRWSAAVSFCHEIAFWRLSTSMSFKILLQRLLLQDLEHATFSARKPSQTSVPIYIWWSFYFYGGKEQLWAIDSKTLSQKTKLLFPLKIWVPTYLFCPQALGLKSRQGILWLRFWKSYLQGMLFLHFRILYLQGIIDLRWDYRLGKEYYNCTFPQELWAPQYDQLDFSATTVTTTLTSTSIVVKDS